MSIYAEHKCPGCGMELSFIVDNGMILRIPSQEEDEKRRKECLSFDFGEGISCWPPPQIVVVGKGPERSAAQILLHPSEPNFLPVEKK
jgi:hypothetical protein